MANAKISQLPAAAALLGSELLEAVQNGSNVKLSLSSIFTALGGYYLVGPGAPYASVTAALAAIAGAPAPTLLTPALIAVLPGTYVTSAPMVIPQYTHVVGLVRPTWPAARFQNDTTDVFRASGFNTFQNLTCIQGNTLSTWFVNCQDNTDISVFDCAMFNTAGPKLQGFVTANGANWARLTVQDSIVNSFQTQNTHALPACAQNSVIALFNTTTAVRFNDTWIRNCFFDMYQLTDFGFAVFASGVQDVRVESGCTLRGTSPSFTGVYLAKGPIVSGTPQMEVRHVYTGGNSVGLFNEAGTVMNILNCDAAGTTTAGTQVVHNSYVGASYNAFPI